MAWNNILLSPRLNTRKDRISYMQIPQGYWFVYTFILMNRMLYHREAFVAARP